MNYYNKYLKYKNKYNIIKNQSGGANTDLLNIKYIKQGADTILYRIEGTDRVIKIMKTSKFWKDNELDVYLEIIKRTTFKDKNIDINFPYIYMLGQMNVPNMALINETTTSINLNTIKSDDTIIRCFIIMDYINGKSIIDIFIFYFQHYINNGVTKDAEYESVKQIFIDVFLDITKKLIYIFQTTNILFGFRHKDFDFRNCLILEDNTPVLLDFGESSINSSLELFCTDLRAFILSFFNLSYYVPILEYDTFRINNSKLILDDLLSNRYIHFLHDTLNKKCIPYQDIDVSLDELLAGIIR